MADDWAQFRSLRFIPSRIPALDALVAFIPAGQPMHAGVKGTLDRIGANRWLEVTGGHELLMPYEGGAYDRARLSVRRKGWDHEICSNCRARIAAMTPCWVTEEGPLRVLCTACKARMDAETSAGA